MTEHGNTGPARPGGEQPGSGSAQYLRRLVDVGVGADADENAGPDAPRAPGLVDDPGIGGKARSLARLAALGLPTPPAFVVTTALGRAMEGAVLGTRGAPEGVCSSRDLDLLAEIRRAWLDASWPAGFGDQLSRELDALGSGAAGGYSVRSSAPSEDDAGALAPGIFATELGVPRTTVEGAVRRVLASAFSPAAWTYLTGRRAAAAGPGPEQADRPTRTPPLGPMTPAVRPATGATPGAIMAVLVHPFVAADASGGAALDPGWSGPRIALTDGQIDASARRTIEDALHRAAARFGAVELEWVVDGARVIFVQLRPYRRGGSPLGRAGAHPGGSEASRRGGPPPTVPIPPWRWDAAHNPAPLSAAQAGLVEWVNAVCATPFEQAVVDGYLYSKPRAGTLPTVKPPAGSEPDDGAGPFDRAPFDALVVETDARLLARGRHPSLEGTLEVFARSYERLFAAIAPTCLGARARLQAELERRFEATDPERAIWFWLVGVPSAATRRAAAARNIARAPDGERREAALGAYLEAFGDESPSWDVVEPTWRERPELVLRACCARPEAATAEAEPEAGTRAGPEPSAVGDRHDGSGRDEGLAALLAAAGAGSHLARLVESARVAAAVMEDDDAFYARLQARVRRALLELGGRLHQDGRLAAVEDVFHLPLTLSRALARHDGSGGRDAAPVADLVAVASAGRSAREQQRLAPPPAAAAGFDTRRAFGQEGPAGGVSGGISWILRGQPGSPGQAVGRAAHHPSVTPLGSGSILIASTLLPTELPLLMAPAGIVVETGSALGHVAAQARERGIPAVVGVAGAFASIPEGALVVVDGDRGEVAWRTDEAHGPGGSRTEIAPG
jgi:phosphohistidine swiveling domain-containing protein